MLVLTLTDEHGELTTLAQDTGADGTQLMRAPADSVMTSALDVPEFSVAAVTWDGLDAPQGRIELRVRAADGWTGWHELEPDDAEHGDIGGTEPFIVGGGTGVQVRFEGTEGSVPNNMALHLIPPTPSEHDVRASDLGDLDGVDLAVANVEEPARTGEPTTDLPPSGAEATAAASTAAVASTTTNRPQVISRAGWGADDSRQIWTVPLRAAVVHHTAGHNNYTQAQSAGIVRGIQRYHVGARGWPDVGYNFLVDKYGQVFEGRRGSLSAPGGEMPEGAHAAGFNNGTLGISVLGDYTTLRAPDIALQRMAEVIAWKFGAARVDMQAPSGFISPGTAARPRGQELPRIFAHRDVAATTCPGNNIYARIPALNAQVAAMMDGDEYHLRNSLNGGPADLAFHLGLSTDEVLVGDWDGDGNDTLALRRGDTYYVYDSHPGYSHRVIRYGRADDTVLVGDWNGDGRDTFAVRRGSTYHVRNSMTGGAADVVINYGRAGDQVLVGDWNGTGTDTFAVRRGSEYHVKNSIAGGAADRVFRYGRDGDDVLVGDWNGTGADTFAVRRGSEYHVRNSLTGGDADVVLSYGRADDVVLVGDWNGDGRDTFGVRRSS